MTGTRRQALAAWHAFLAGQGHVLRRRPHLLFQQAFNAAPGTAPALAARARPVSAKRPWVEWLDRPPATSPWRLSLGSGTSALTACAFAPDGTRIAACSEAGLITEWDAATGRELASFPSLSDRLWYSADGARIIASGRVPGGDAELQVWNRATATKVSAAGVRAFAIHTGMDCDLVLGESGKSGESVLALWRLSPFQCLRTLSPPEHPIEAGDLSRDGRFAAATDGYEFTVWDVASGERVANHPLPAMWLPVLPVPAQFCRLSPDARLVAAGTVAADRGGRVVVIAVDTGAVLLEPGERAAGVLAAAFDEAGTRLLTASRDGTLALWDIASGSELRRFRGHAFHVLDCIFSPDGREVASASADGWLHVWPVEGDDAPQHPGVAACAVAPDGGELALLTGRPPGLAVLPAGEAARAHAAPFVKEVRRCLAYSPDGARLVTGSTEPDALVLRVPGYRVSLRLAELTSNVRACAFSPDGRWVLAGTCWPDPLMVWDGETGGPVRALAGVRAEVRACAFSPDGALVAACWDNAPPNLQLWDLTGQRPPPEFAGHATDAVCCAFSPDGHVLASCSRLETVLWDVRSGAAVRRWPGTGNARRLAFTRDLRHLLATDGTILLALDVDEGREAAWFECESYVHTLAAGTRGEIWAGTTDGLFRLRLRGIDSGPAVVTATLPYDYRAWAWSRIPVTRCGRCGVLADTPAEVLAALEEIATTYAVPSPVAADLPAAAWDHPALQTRCAACGAALIHNPFLCRSPFADDAA